MIGDYSRRAGSGGIGPVKTGRRLVLLAGMVIEPEADTAVVRQVGQDVVGGEGHYAVLDVLRVREINRLDVLDFLQQECAGQTIQVSAGYQTHGLTSGVGGVL